MIRAIKETLRRRAVRRWVDSLPTALRFDRVEPWKHPVWIARPRGWNYVGPCPRNRCKLHGLTPSKKPHVRYFY